MSLTVPNSFRVIKKKIMESKKFCLVQHCTSYDDLKEKIKKYGEEKFGKVWISDSRTIEAARVKKEIPAIKFYEIRYARKKRKYWTEVIVVSRFSSGFVTV